MSKAAIVSVVVVVVVLAGCGILLAARGGSDKTDSTSPTKQSSMADMDMSSQKNTGTTPAATDDNSGSATAAHAVEIDNFAFGPANITVAKGTTVTWTNKDSTTHTVTETDGQKGPDSGNLATGKSYSFTYDTAGTFKYHCAIHPDMLGTVTVTE